MRLTKSNLGEVGEFKCTDERALEVGTPLITKPHGLKIQRYLHNAKSLLAHLPSSSSVEDEPPQCVKYSAEALAASLGDLDTTTCELEVLTALVRLGSLAPMGDAELKGLIMMDHTLGSLI